MNSHYQTVLDIKSHTHQTSPFILKIPANSTSQQHINLSISAHILKKIALIDFSVSRELTELYKHSLLDAIQNPLLDIKSSQVIEQLLYYLEYWNFTLGKTSSWPHTRTCFYYLQDKLKKNKLYQNLDSVRLKRAQLQPNKKQFLSRIMAEDIHSEQLKAYIVQLKQQSQSKSQSGSIQNRFQHLSQNNILLQESNKQKIQISSNILYSDNKQDWKEISKTIDSIKSLQRKSNHQSQQTFSLKEQLNQIFQTYIIQKLPILLNIMKNKKLKKQELIEELNMRKKVIDKLNRTEMTETLNMTISKVFYNHLL